MGIIDRIKQNIDETAELKLIEEAAYQKSRTDGFDKRVEAAKERGRKRGTGELARERQDKFDVIVQKGVKMAQKLGENVGEFYANQPTTPAQNGGSSEQYDPFKVLDSAKKVDYGQSDPLGICPSGEPDAPKTKKSIFPLLGIEHE